MHFWRVGKQQNSEIQPFCITSHLWISFLKYRDTKRFGLVSLFNSISTFVGYLMPKFILVEEQAWYNLTHSRGWVGKEVHTFSKSISHKVNVVVQLEFEPSYHDVTVHHITHHATGILPSPRYKKEKLFRIVVEIINVQNIEYNFWIQLWIVQSHKWIRSMKY